MALVGNMPAGWIFSAFSIGRNQLPYAALALLAGGNIRVGLEDNIWLDKGVLATNGDLVDRARQSAEAMGAPRARPGRGAGEAQPASGAGAERAANRPLRRASAAASSAPAGSRG